MVLMINMILEWDNDDDAGEYDTIVDDDDDGDGDDDNNN